MNERVLATDYLDARGDAFDGRECMDPTIADFFGQDEHRDLELWLAFMAGSDWERKYVGRRYRDEVNGVQAHLERDK
jgi:hypothetical protein